MLGTRGHHAPLSPQQLGVADTWTESNSFVRNARDEQLRTQSMLDEQPVRNQGLVHVSPSNFKKLLYGRGWTFYNRAKVWVVVERALGTRPSELRNRSSGD